MALSRSGELFKWGNSVHDYPRVIKSDVLYMNVGNKWGICVDDLY